MTLLGNPTRKRGLKRIFLAYASGYQVSNQHQFVITALAVLGDKVVHVVGKCFHAFHRHRIVNASANAADAAMTG